MKKKYILVLIAFISSQIFASGGSVYTRYGVGDLYYSNSAKTLALGGIGASMISTKDININNPAIWSKINYTKFNAGVSSKVYSIDDSDQNSMYSQVKFSGFNIGFPIERDLGIGFVLGIIPYSNVEYEVINNVQDNVFGDYEEKFEGTGGLTKAFFGLGFNIIKDFSLGVSFNYYTGNFQYKSSFLYNTSSDFNNSNFATKYENKGLGTTIGFESPDLSSYLGVESINELRFGGTYEISGSINSDTTFSSFSSLGTKDIIQGNSHIKMPNKLLLGLSMIMSNNYLFVIDYLYQPWSNLEVNKVFVDNLKDVNRFSLGVEYGKHLKKYGSFWELIKYRGGLSYEQSQYEINGEGIDQLGVHAGISFPLGLDNSIDIGLMYGIRGKANNGLLKENIFEASFSLNFGEMWFSRRDR